MAYNNKIPIVLSSDENYAKYMYVTIFSLLENRNINSDYDLWILTDDSFKTNTKNKLEKLAKKFGVEIHFLNMRNSFSDSVLNIPHITTPTYYRLKIPEILQQYDKAIYLDTDIIVLKDLSEMFNIDIRDYYVAGVKAPAFILSEQIKLRMEQYGYNSIDSYINSGVTVWNLEKIRKDGKIPELYAWAGKNLPVQDQDVINIVFEGKIKHIPLKYNLMVKYPDLANKNSVKYQKYKEIFSEDMIDEAVNNPVIIHYANKEKPWNNILWLDNIWWKYAQKSCFEFWVQKHIFSIKNICKNKINRKIVNALGLKFKFRLG